MSKIGIFGGTFNPLHMGHLIVCQSLLMQESLQKIVFIPSAVSPHKRIKGLAPPDFRLQMTKLAILDNPMFEVSDIEIKRGGISYTVDTLKALCDLYPQSNLSLIIGMDNWMEFKSWRNPDEIMELADILVMNRPGFNKIGFEHSLNKNVKFIDVPGIDISGTMIRIFIKSGRSIKYLVPKPVEQFIVDHGLFRD